MGFRTLEHIAGATQQLQVADMVGPAPGLGNDVIDLQIAPLEVRLASVAVAALCAVQVLPVSDVVVADHLLEIRPLRHIRPVHTPEEQLQIILHHDCHQLSGLG